MCCEWGRGRVIPVSSLFLFLGIAPLTCISFSVTLSRGGCTKGWLHERLVDPVASNLVSPIDRFQPRALFVALARGRAWPGYQPNPRAMRTGLNLG